MAKLQTHQCPHCGAGMQLQPAAGQPYSVSCQYCGTPITVVPQVKHVAHAAASAQQQYGPNVIVTSQAASRAGCLITAITLGATLIPILIIAAANLLAPAWNYVSMRVSPVSFPASCPANGELVIEDRNEKLDKPLIEAGVNCKVKIVNSKLEAPIIIKAQSNITITIENSTLKAKEAIVRGQHNTVVHLLNKSSVEAPTFVHAGSNVEVIIGQSKVNVSETVIACEANPKMTVTGSTITSSGTLFDAKHNAKLALDASTVTVSRGMGRNLSNLEVKAKKKSSIRSDDVPITAGSNLKLELDDSEVYGKRGAIHAESNPDIDLRAGSTIRSDRDAIVAGSNLKLEVAEGSKVLAGGVAIAADHNAKVTVRSKGLIKGATAIRTKFNAKITIDGGRLEGTRDLGRNADVDER